MPHASALARLRLRAVLIWRGACQKFDRLAESLFPFEHGDPSPDTWPTNPHPIFAAHVRSEAPVQTSGRGRTLREEVAELRAELLRHRREFDQFAAETNATHTTLRATYLHAIHRDIATLRKAIEQHQAIRDSDLRGRLETFRKVYDAIKEVAGAAGHRCDTLQAQVDELRAAQSSYINRNEAFRREAIKTFRESTQIFAVIGHDMQAVRDRIEAAEKSIRSAALADLNPLDAQTVQDLEDLRRRMGEIEDRFAARTNLLGAPSQN